jgi:hypothetical protein
VVFIVSHEQTKRTQHRPQPSNTTNDVNGTPPPTNNQTNNQPNNNAYGCPRTTGLTNAVTAVKNAQLAQSPLLVLGGATRFVEESCWSFRSLRPFFPFFLSFFLPSFLFPGFALRATPLLS